MDQYEKENARIRKILEDCDTDDGDQNIDSAESHYEANDISDDSDTDFVRNIRRKKIHLITTSESENNDSEIDDNPIAAAESENNETIIDDDIWYENTKKIVEFEFNDNECGVKMNADANSSPREIFDQLFSSNIIKTIVKATNKYGKNLFEAKRPATRKSRKITFLETNKEKLLKFLGLCLLQGQKKCPSIRHLFSNHPLYYSPVFSHTMSGRRFEQLLRCINGHYNGESDSNTVGIRKIDPLLKPILANFQTAFSPSKYLSLDESLLLFRGRLSFRQCIKGKKAKYGIKLYELTTPDGYVLNVEIYQGKQGDLEKSTKTVDLVLRLMQSYLHKGHHLFMDNFYNSIELSKILLSYKTHSTGTLRSNRRGNPEEIISKKLRRGEHIWRRQGEIYIKMAG